MKIYKHFTTLLLRDGDNSIQVISYSNSLYDFYEGSMMLDPNEDIVNFYQHTNLLVYYTTKKRIIAASLNTCQYQCLFVEGEPYVPQSVMSFPRYCSVVQEKVEHVVFGSDCAVYYDGNFHLICDGDFFERSMCDMSCFFEQGLKFLTLGIHRLNVPFNSNKITQVSVKRGFEVEKKEISEASLLRDHFEMLGPDQEYMLCDLGQGQYYILVPVMYSSKKRGLECHYFRAGANLKTRNLLFRTDDKTKSNKGISLMAIHEGSDSVGDLLPTGQYNKTKPPVERTPMGFVSAALKETGLKNIFPSIVYDGIPCASSQDMSMTGYVIDAPKTGVFENSDVYQYRFVCLINSRGRLWKNINGFIIMVEDNVVIVYTPHMITNTEQEVHPSNMHAYLLPKTSKPIKSIYAIGGSAVLIAEDNMHALTFTNAVFENGIVKYEYQMGEINFSLCRNRIDKALVFYRNHDNVQRTWYTTEDSNHLNEMITACKTLSQEYMVSIKIVEEREGEQLDVAQGDGTTRYFIDKALKEFSDLYLTEGARWPTLRLEICTLKQKELWRLGATLSMMIDLMEAPLPIRLPVVIIEAIYSKEFAGDDLEYFAKEQNPIAFANLLPYKKDPSGFSDLDTEFLSYDEAVSDMCGYPVVSTLSNESVGKIIAAAREIGVGFKKHRSIKNLDKMNMPTLDYYLSGPFIIDRKELCGRIQVTVDDNLFEVGMDSHSVQIKISKIIMALTEPELKQLLINWSGAPVLQKVYEVKVVENSDVYFRTCFCLVVIPPMYFGELLCELKNLLVTPVGYMKD